MFHLVTHGESGEIVSVYSSERWMDCIVYAITVLCRVKCLMVDPEGTVYAL